MFTFDVSPDHGEAYRLTATSRDVSRWERTTKGASFGRLEKDLRMSDLEAVAHCAATRLGKFGGGLEEWRNTVDVVPVDPNAATGADDEGDEEGPTPQGP